MFILNWFKKRLFSLFLLGTVVSALILSCGKSDSTTAPLAQVTYVQFIPASGYFSSTYLLKSTSGPLVIPVGLSTISTVDRTINVSYSSRTAVAGNQFTAPATVIVKAGALIDSLRFQGNFSAYAAGGTDTVKVKLSGAGYSVNNGSDSFFVIIQQPICAVVPANLTGNYTQSTDYYNGVISAKPKYTASISNWVAVSSVSATITLKNIGATPDNGWGYATASGGFRSTDPVITPGLTATLDWTDPVNPTITIPLQNYFNDGSGMSTIKATGTFSSCKSTFNINCTVKYAGDGNNYNHTSVLNR